MPAALFVNSIPGRFLNQNDLDAIGHPLKSLNRITAANTGGAVAVSYTHLLAEGGANAVRRIYSAERQIKPRIALVGQEMEEARREQADLPAKIQQTGRIKTWAYRVFGILEDGKLKELAEDVCTERNSLERCV